MPKLAWVALPLLGVLAAWGLLALGGRRLSRLQLNVASSLLLLAYLGTTAGLGIFWVANQQLPVFDWHYLFGYLTLALLAVHLAFNLRVVWRTLVRPRPAATAPPAVVAPARRRWMALLAVALPAGAMGFWLGRRQGRLDAPAEALAPPLPPAADPGERQAQAMAEVERLHAMSTQLRAGVLMRAPPVDWGFAPPPFKDEAGERLALPPPRPAAGLATVSTLLWHTTGITQRRGGLALRASPASGALFSTELYLASRGDGGVPAGLWHHDARTDSLVRLRDLPAGDEALGAPPGATDGAVLGLMATAVFRRTGHKYRDRAYRYLWADLGHALENLRQAAAACGLQAVLLPAFDGPAAERALGLQTGEEGVLAWVVLRPAGSTPPPATAAARWDPVPAPSRPAIGVTSIAHARTSLQRSASGEVAGEAATDATNGATTADEILPLPAPQPREGDVLTLIARRRSRRRFATRPLPLRVLASLLAGLQPAPVLSGAVRIDLVVHAVEGLAPGAYRYRPDRHGLLRRAGTAGPRAIARAAALDQDVIGDGAAVLVLSADRRAIAADPLGPLRGYRHAFIEAGLVGERLYLEAGARGLGACAVGAFYDDEAAALVGLERQREWPVHFAAVGWPA